MIPEYTEILAFRLSSQERFQIESQIKKGEFKNLSQVIRAALKDFLSEHK